MKPDRLTQLLLSAIALFLGVIAVNGTGGVASNTLAQVPAAPQRNFEHLRLSGDANGFYLFDSHTGRIWYYQAAAGFRGRPDEIGQIEAPGGRLAR